MWRNLSAHVRRKRTHVGFTQNPLAFALSRETNHPVACRYRVQHQPSQQLLGQLCNKKPLLQTQERGPEQEAIPAEGCYIGRRVPLYLKVLQVTPASLHYRLYQTGTG